MAFERAENDSLPLQGHVATLVDLLVELHRDRLMAGGHPAVDPGACCQKSAQLPQCGRAQDFFDRNQHDGSPNASRPNALGRCSAPEARAPEPFVDRARGLRRTDATGRRAARPSQAERHPFMKALRSSPFLPAASTLHFFIFSCCVIGALAEAAGDSLANTGAEHASTIAAERVSSRFMSFS